MAERECERERGLHFCMSAFVYLHCGAQHAKGQYHASLDKVTSFRNWPCELQRQPGGLCVVICLKCLYYPFMTMVTHNPTDCLRRAFLNIFLTVPPGLITFGGYCCFLCESQSLFGFYCCHLQMISLRVP